MTLARLSTKTLRRIASRMTTDNRASTNTSPTTANNNNSGNIASSTKKFQGTEETKAARMSTKTVHRMASLVATRRKDPCKFLKPQCMVSVWLCERMSTPP